MTRLLLTVFLMFTITVFWYTFSSKYVGFLYNPETQSKEFLHRNYSNLFVLALNTTDDLTEGFRFFSSKGVKIVIGPPTSMDGEKALPFLKKYNMIALSATISSTKLLNSNYFFSFTPSNRFIVEKMKQLLSKLETKNLLLLSDPKNKQYSDEFAELLRTFKGKNVYYYNESTLKSINPEKYDTVVMSLFAKDAAMATKLLKSVNPTINIVGTDSVMSADFTSYAGSAAEGTYLIYSMDYLENPELELINEVTDFISKHRFLSTDQFRRFMRKNVIETSKGRYNFVDNSINRTVKVFQVINGKYVEKENY